MFIGKLPSRATNIARVQGSTNGTNGIPISFKVLPMVLLVLPMVPLVIGYVGMTSLQVPRSRTEVNTSVFIAVF